MVEDRRGNGLGEHGLKQYTGFGIGGDEVGAAAQRVGDADRVVVGVEQRPLSRSMGTPKHNSWH
ncbi:hypothetical protein [Streptomyces sp. NPDC056921]|uniref:hypothetical protein n=1 Tax=Streptomyces sp. NPDC056921 TaxID=3345966 RepID=UPI00363C29B6